MQLRERGISRHSAGFGKEGAPTRVWKILRECCNIKEHIWSVLGQAVCNQQFRLSTMMHVVYRSSEVKPSIRSPRNPTPRLHLLPRKWKCKGLYQPREYSSHPQQWDKNPCVRHSGTSQAEFGTFTRLVKLGVGISSLALAALGISL